MPGLWRHPAGGKAVTGLPCYRVAGLTWFSSRPIGILEPFSVDASGAGPDEGPTRFPDVEASTATTGWLAGSQRSTEAKYQEGACHLTVEGLGEFFIQPNQVTYRKPSAMGSSADIVETLLGPALLLALAGNHRFSLHASAAQVADQRLWLFLGDTGVGKSTIATAIGSQPSCRPVADDVLPVHWDGEKLWALPWYPQLKLGDHGQYAGGTVPERIPVSAVFLLAPSDATAAVTLEQVSPLEATSALVHLTVSARLFSPSLLARNFNDFAAAGRLLPVFRLQVPRDLGRLEEVFHKISS